MQDSGAFASPTPLNQSHTLKSFKYFELLHIYRYIYTHIPIHFREVFDMHIKLNKKLNQHTTKEGEEKL